MQIFPGLLLIICTALPLEAESAKSHPFNGFDTLKEDADGVEKFSWRDTSQAGDKEPGRFSDIHEWLSKIPKEAHKLQLITYGIIGTNWYALFRSNDGRIAICFGSPKENEPYSIAYDICDLKGNSLISTDNAKKPVSLEKTVKVAHSGADWTNHTVGYGWLRAIEHPKVATDLFFRISTNGGKDVWINIGEAGDKTQQPPFERPSEMPAKK